MAQRYSRIVVVGSVAFDNVMRLPGVFRDFIMPDRVDRLNVSFTVETLRKEFGGTGGNCAYSLGLLDMHPVLVSAWGKDSEAYEQHLQGVGVDTSHVLRDEQVYTATGHVMTDHDNNQMWMFYPGALKRMAEIRLQDVLQDGDLVVLMPSQPQAFSKHLQEVVEFGKDFVFDPSFFVPNLSVTELKMGIERAKIVIGNEYEIGLMEQKVGIPVNKWGIEDGKVIVKTMGDRGSYAWFGDQVLEIPPVTPDEVNDPTGAGDTYRAGFLAGYVQDMSIETCARMGSLMASYCVEKDGTQVHGLSLDEYLAKYVKAFGEELEYGRDL